MRKESIRREEGLGEGGMSGNETTRPSREELEPFRSSFQSSNLN